jgi:hypothetical protein
MLVSVLALQSCITYYKPDPFAGLDFGRARRGTVVEASVNRYSAESYFDGEDETPHTSTSSKPDQKYTREDIILRSTTAFSGGPDLVLVLPITHVRQLGTENAEGEPGKWRVEHLWLGANILSTPDRRFSLMFGLGMPIGGDINTMASAGQDHDGTARATIQPILTNGFPEGGFGYYLRLGAGIHMGTDDEDVDRIYELPGELVLSAPVGERASVGFRSDARFTLIDYGGQQGTQSRDVIAIGPYISFAATKDWRIKATYREEVIGYFTSAGSSWHIGISHVLRGP